MKLQLANYRSCLRFVRLSIPPSPPNTRLFPLSEGLIEKGRRCPSFIIPGTSSAHWGKAAEGEKRRAGAFNPLVPSSNWGLWLPAAASPPRAAVLGFAPLPGATPGEEQPKGAGGRPGDASSSLCIPEAALEQEGQTPASGLAGALQTAFQGAVTGRDPEDRGHHPRAMTQEHHGPRPQGHSPRRGLRCRGPGIPARLARPPPASSAALAAGWLQTGLKPI